MHKEIPLTGSKKNVSTPKGEDILTCIPEYE